MSAPIMAKPLADGTYLATDITTELYDGRILRLDGEVTQEACMELCSLLLLLEREDPEAPVTLIISSPGGSVMAGLALIDVMADVSCPVHTVALGMVASMGSVILACGDERAAYPHAEVMVHQIMAGGGGMSQQTDVEIAARHTARLRRTLDELLAAHSKLTAEEVHDLTERDCYLTAEEALGYGFIDKIVGR